MYGSELAMHNATLFTQSHHNNPPVFNSVERRFHLQLDENFKEGPLKDVRKNSNRVFLCLAYRYFCMSNQFFDTSIPEDIAYISQQLGIANPPEWNSYQADSKKRHKRIILDYMGVKPFTDSDAQKLITEKLQHLAKCQLPFKQAFKTLVVFLREKHIEIPDFRTLDTKIRNTYKAVVDDRIILVEEHLDTDAKTSLDTLLDKSPDAVHAQYQLTLLKTFSQKLRPREIAGNVESFKKLHTLFGLITPALKALQLPTDAIKYYAKKVVKSQVFQIERRADADRYLHLVCFIADRYYTLQDILADTLRQSVTTAYNAAEKQAREHFYKARQTQHTHAQNLVTCTTDLYKAVQQIETILNDDTLTAEQKVAKVSDAVLRTKPKRDKTEQSIADVTSDLDKLSGDALLYHFLEEGARKLQLRCNALVTCLQFSDDSVDKSLLSVIQRFQDNDGKVDATFPVDFLSVKDRRHIDTKLTFRSPLYKVVLFKYITEAIFGDGLSLPYSYEHRAFDDYLIPQQVLDENFISLLTQTDALHLKDKDKVINQIVARLDTDYQQTNEHVMMEANDFVKGDGLGGFRLAHSKMNTQQIEEIAQADIDLFPQTLRVTLPEVLHTVHTCTGCLNELQPHSQLYNKKRPENRELVAGLIGKGLHFSEHEFAKIMRQTNKSTVATVQKNFLSNENCILASNVIMHFVDKMPLADLFLVNSDPITSSDGVKYTNSKGSLNARNSFRYGGKEEVVNAYLANDCRSLFTHADVIGGAEREAPYTIDCVLNQAVVKSKMHVTDTHGYTNMIFGATDLLSITYAPRIKNIHRLQRYAPKGKKKSYSHKGYPILPNKNINLDHINAGWNELVRMVVSIKLGYTSASQLFKRLNSYTSDRNPLKKALTAYGQITKTSYILEYIDNLELRQIIHKQLNKGESGNRLDRALAIGSSGLDYVEKDEQIEVENCKRVIKNAIICWNYMYLSQRLMNTENAAERRALIEKIKASSANAWDHVVIHGEIDFSDSHLADSQHFAFERMHDLDILLFD
ncbi:Tn3-like element TnAs1 family transposase [Aliiglaciecola aliphaticivorans]